MNYKTRVQSLSQTGKEYLIDQLDLSGGVDHLVAFYTSDVADNVNIENELQQRVEATLPKHMHPSKFIQLQQVPRLSNGKVDHGSLPELDVSRIDSAKPDLPDIDQNQPQNNGQVTTLIKILESLLDFEGILPTDNFFELGGDSITAIRLVSRAREAGLNISVASVAIEPDLQSLVSTLQVDAEVVVESPSPFGPSPLTPIQKWFFSIEHPRVAHWNLGGRVTMAASADSARLQKAVQCCIAGHPELGVQFHRVEGQWSCHYPESRVPSDLCMLLRPQGADELSSFLAECSETFSLQSGWMIRFAIVEDQAGSAIEMVWAAHHLIVDQLSIQTLMEEIEKIYTADDYTIGAYTALSMRAWALACEAQSNKLVENSNQLLQHSNSVGERSPIYTKEKATENDVVSIEQTLGLAESTALLQMAADTHGCDIPSLLVAALAVSWRKVFLVDTLPVDIEGHGRDLLGEGFDTAGSVGWHSAFYPVDLVMKDSMNALSMDFCRRVSQIILQQKKERGKFLLYGNLSQGVPSRFGNNGRVLVNFLGGVSAEKNSFFMPLAMSTKGLRSGDNLRAHNVEVNAFINAGRLNILWSLSSTCMSIEKRQQFISGFVSHLKEVSDIWSKQVEAPITTAVTDFPDVDMSQSDLDEFLDSLE